MASSDISQLQHLIRALVAAAASAHAAVPGAAEAESVLVDTDLDGARYLLLRMPCAEQSRLPLSPRELEIVRMVAHGHPNKVIAGILNISAWTVCAHVRRIFAKLGVSSRAAMVARLLKAGGGGVPLARPRPTAASAGGAHSAAHPRPRVEAAQGWPGRDQAAPLSPSRQAEPDRAAATAGRAKPRSARDVRAPTPHKRPVSA